MARTRRSCAIVIANLLLPVGILIFSSGFFPYKPLLPGLATFDEVDRNKTSAVFNKVIFMVVDALRRWEDAGTSLQLFSLKQGTVILSILANPNFYLRKGVRHTLIGDESSIALIQL